MYLHKLVKSNTGKYIMSILLGIGLSTFFRSICKGKDCIVYAAPPLDDIEDKIYKFDGKCYKFEKEAINCEKNKKTVKIA